MGHKIKSTRNHPHYTEAEKSKVLTLHFLKFSTRQIQQATGIPHQTVSDLTRKYYRSSTFENKKPTGRKSKINASMMKWIEDQIKENDYISIPDIKLKLLHRREVISLL